MISPIIIIKDKGFIDVLKLTACNLNTNLFFSRMHRLFRRGPQEWRNILVWVVVTRRSKRDIEERRDRTKKTKKTKKTRCRQSGKQYLAETYEPSSRSHRRRVSHPLVRAHENTTRPLRELKCENLTPRQTSQASEKKKKLRE